MSSQQRQAVILVVLLFVWAGVIAWTWFGAEPPQRVPLTNVGTVSLEGQGSRNRSTSDSSTVHLAKLKASRAQRAAAPLNPKNVFELTRSDRPPGGSESIPIIEPLPEETAPSAETEVADLAWAELAEFRYLGYVELGGNGRNRRELALLAKRDVLHTVKSGEWIGRTVLVKSITPTSVILRHAASQLEQRLTLAPEG